VSAGVQDSEALEEEAWKVSTKMMSLHIRGGGLLQLLCLENGSIGKQALAHVNGESSCTFCMKKLLHILDEESSCTFCMTKLFRIFNEAFSHFE
jgi:hypothetical protein